MHGLVGGEWGLTLRPALAAMLRTTPLMALLLIPVLIGAPSIYPWALAGGHGWLSLPFFVGRAIAYVVLWNVIALGSGATAADGRLPPGFAWPALIVLFGTSTLAAFDWVMTLEPRWTSTIFGLLVTTGWVLSRARHRHRRGGAVQAGGARSTRRPASCSRSSCSGPICRRSSSS